MGLNSYWNIMIELSREWTIPLMNASTWSLECVWPHYNPRLVSSVSYVYDHLHTVCFGKSGCILYVCLHMLPTGPSAVAHVRSLLIVNEDWYPWALTLGLGFPGGSRSHWSFGSHVLLDKLLSQHSIGRLNGHAVEIYACQSKREGHQNLAHHAH